MGGMPNGGVTMRIEWTSRKLFKPLMIFDSGRTKKTRGKVTRCYVALGSGLALDHPGLRDRKSPEQYETHQRSEA